MAHASPISRSATGRPTRSSRPLKPPKLPQQPKPQALHSRRTEARRFEHVPKASHRPSSSPARQPARDLVPPVAGEELLEQRKHEAAIATEHAAQAAQREREAGASLQETRARERDAMEEVSTLQRSLSSGSGVAA